ncbi:MAG: hypothetical protein ACR2NP_21540 [Pirellulaceae bacterium]
MTVLRICVVLTCVTFVAWVDPCRTAAQEEATSAADVLERYVEALGGEMALQSLEAAEYEGTIDSAGTPGTFTFLHAQGKCAMTVNLSGRPVVRLGFDGEYLWQQHGPRGFKHQAERFVGLGVDLPGTPMTALEWLELKDDSTLLESKRVSERLTDVVRIAMPDGQLVTGFFDQESGLLVQAVYDSGETPTLYMLEYADEPIESLRFVNKATASVAGTPRFVWTVDSIVANPKLKGDEFRVPDGLIEGEPGGG